MKIHTCHPLCVPVFHYQDPSTNTSIHGCKQHSLDNDGVDGTAPDGVVTLLTRSRHSHTTLLGPGCAAAMDGHTPLCCGWDVGAAQHWALLCSKSCDGFVFFWPRRMDLTWSKLSASFAANASICLFEPQGFFTNYIGPSDPVGMEFAQDKRKPNIDFRMVFIKNRKKKS